MRRMILAISAILAISSAGFAESTDLELAGPYYTDDNSKEGLYVGIAYARPSHDVDYSNDKNLLEIDFNSMMLQVGYRADLDKDYFVDLAVEARLWSSFSAENSTTGDSDDSDITAYGVYLKTIYPMSREIDAYAMFGFAKTDESSPHAFLPVNDSDFSWGVGISYDLTGDFSIFADYYEFSESVAGDYHHVLDGYAIGITYSF